jgi:hypothetical protein
MKHKTIFMRMDPIFLPNIQGRLERMAQKGWMLEEVNRYSMTFKKCEPQTLRFNILINPENEFKRYNLGPIGDVEELCVADGWRFVVRNTVYAVFAHVDENPIPIYSDPQTLISPIKEQIQNKLFITLGFALILVVTFMSIIGTLNYRSVYDPFLIYMSVFYLMAISAAVFDLLPNLFWFGYAKRKTGKDIFAYPDFVFVGSSILQYYLSFLPIMLILVVPFFNPLDYSLTIFAIAGIAIFAMTILAGIRKREGKYGYRLPIELAIRYTGLLTIIVFIALGGFNYMAKSIFLTDRAIRLSDFDSSSINTTEYNRPSVGLFAMKTIDYTELKASKYTNTLIVRFYSTSILNAYWKDRIEELDAKKTILAEWEMQGYYSQDKTAIIIRRGMEVIEIQTEVDLSDMKNVAIVKHRLGITE